MSSESPLIKLLTTKYSRFLGGIDASRALRDNEEARVKWLSDYLGINIEPQGYDAYGEVRRIRVMYEWLRIEEANVQGAVAEARRMGVPLSNVEGRLRGIRRRREFLRRLLREIRNSGV
ncbi:hypothetical protein [Caldivirga maquilingensis]|uniref:Uncharacterized protein n=1 Tax=Caldivirga maquilingensis (strain ATCC 700844 / DSM 13496 / JCM 10307 / IC-167) TaxID=397948 RepID=A8MBR8_CALMQ|nr:hypothetical protein [Caldivirga maquilingensis]ABW01261.1 hypothetical protein Cmaq_0416 [Caldivirga maquilingensis IC-167]